MGLQGQIPAASQQIGLPDLGGDYAFSDALLNGGRWDQRRRGWCRGRLGGYGKRLVHGALDLVALCRQPADPFLEPRQFGAEPGEGLGGETLRPVRRAVAFGTKGERVGAALVNLTRRGNLPVEVLPALHQALGRGIEGRKLRGDFPGTRLERGEGMGQMGGKEGAGVARRAKAGPFWPPKGWLGLAETERLRRTLSGSVACGSFCGVVGAWAWR